MKYHELLSGKQQVIRVRGSELFQMVVGKGFLSSVRLLTRFCEAEVMELSKNSASLRDV